MILLNSAQQTLIEISHSGQRLMIIKSHLALGKLLTFVLKIDTKDLMKLEGTT